MERLLLKPSEVTQILGIGRSLVYELIAQKEIPSIRLGRCIRIPSESLQRWLKDQESSKSDEIKDSGIKEAVGGLPPRLNRVNNG